MRLLKVKKKKSSQEIVYVKQLTKSISQQQNKQLSAQIQFQQTKFFDLINHLAIARQLRMRLCLSRPYQRVS